MFMVAAIKTVAEQQFSAMGYTTNLRVRTGLMAAIYEKTLVLSNDSQKLYSIGEIISRMSIDTAEVSYFVGDISYQVWSLPLQITIALYMLYNMLGWSVFVGVGFTIIGIPLSSHISKLMSNLGFLSMQYKDKRIRIIDEVLAGIRIIKLYAWENPFIKKIRNIRNDQELGAMKKRGVYQTYSIFVLTMLPFLVTFSAFATYSLFGNQSHGPLSLKLVFVSMALFKMIEAPINQASYILFAVVQANISIKRLKDFLSSGEIDQSAINYVHYNRNDASSSSDDVLVSVQSGSFKWLSADETTTINNVTVQCKRNELVAIIGRVGSGKSSLVSAILGNMIKTSGNATIRGSVAYVPQQPWIINATLRDNILFGHELDPEFYDKVIEACALKPDLEMLPAGDMTEIGEKGINLSGGQKARLSLARAVYARADIYILDDPLAAVDAHVSKHLFTQVIGPSGLLASRARILVTNAVQYLPATSFVVMLSGGNVVEQGTSSEVLNSNGPVYEFVRKYIDSSTDSVKPQSSDMCASVKIDYGKARKASATRAIAPDASSDSDSNGGVDDLETGQLIQTEANQHGTVKSSIYSKYIKACGLENIILYFVLQTLASLTGIASNFWLKHWASKNESARTELPGIFSQHDVAFYLATYGMLGLASSVVSSLRSLMIWAKCSIKASEKIHDNMLLGVMHSPMSYFDVTPMGRIINRFSADMLTCDLTIPWAMSAILSVAFNIFSSVAVIGISMPILLVAFIPIVFVYRYLQHTYSASSRELSRIVSSTRSPVYSHIQETISGAASIRAFAHQQRYIMDNEQYMENNVQASYIDRCIGRWLALRLEWLGDLILLGVTLCAVGVLHYYGHGDAGLVGLSITYAISLTSFLGSSVSSYVDADNAMTDLERVVEYSNLPSEAPKIIDSHRPPTSWPEQGMVEFRNYSTRYRDNLELTLRDVSFCVQPMQKVGIVGRTGAGKSSLTLALFRIIEAVSGQILIDGQDIAQYGLFDVRSKLSIIPQDPVLFVGTVRDNVDPIGSYTDQQIWSALENAHLAEYIRSKDKGLDFEVEQGGSNFSVGQRQLICLARALLRRAKILVLDEATAAIDNETDAIIQKSIREQFRNCTVLTIAHRLETVTDSDMILVVDGGKVAEFDTPGNLLASESSLFAQLMQESQKHHG
ncbi:hypothetical protein LPJ53_003386 [Coemansia erecta]|uniref:P-loop containing nucleoside triphosphate hydrolase protein n=1 Tax=Coemansia erecta TaxID=147472 RepID=A0A9W7XZZ1_9FUNG|nr:hypothetical protein LPJ53_003386 [Coemansia erecta]